MRIRLAGFNVDYDLLRELERQQPDHPPLTPEIFSAAYARISRSPKSVTELRKLATKEIKKARRSNRNIIFSMGHHSVAEHAVFNFDIMGVSRLLAESIEKFRLNSYTEKSQRYIRLRGNFVVPKRLHKSSFEKPFREAIQQGITLYHRLYEAIITHESRKLPSPPGEDEKKQICLKANEDARYILSLAQKTQIGETMNARNLELLLRRFASSELDEARECGERMYRLVRKIAPSIILFYRENDFDRITYPALRNYASTLKGRGAGKREKPVSLIDWTRDADALLISSILHTVSSMPFESILKAVKSMNAKKKKEVLKKAFAHLQLYDSVLREFEYPSCTFSAIVSASCFAQLKRHRMATLTCQRYDPDLGVTIPRSVRDAGMEGECSSFIDSINGLFAKMESRFPVEAQYLLTNGHRKRILLSANARELYHMSRLREDEHAQWEIREVTETMIQQAKEKMPLTLLVIGGKDRYPAIYKSVFGRYPEVIQPVLPS